MSKGPRSIEVYADWIGPKAATRLGTLLVNDRRGRKAEPLEGSASQTISLASTTRTAWAPFALLL